MKPSLHTKHKSNWVVVMLCISYTSEFDFVVFYLGPLKYIHELISELCWHHRIGWKVFFFFINFKTTWGYSLLLFCFVIVFIERYVSASISLIVIRLYKQVFLLLSQFWCYICLRNSFISSKYQNYWHIDIDSILFIFKSLFICIDVSLFILTWFICLLSSLEKSYKNFNHLIIFFLRHSYNI